MSPPFSRKLCHLGRSALLAGLLTIRSVAADNSSGAPINADNKTMTARPQSSPKTSGYAPIGGLKMYYEIEGSGEPLVFIPPVFGFAGMKSFPMLTQRHTVITIDLQGFGRTADIPERPLSIEQNARDVIALLEYLKIPKADFLGESYGAATAVLIAVTRPDLVRRVAAYGGTFGPPAVAHNLEMLHFDRPLTPDGDSHRYQRVEYAKVAADPSYWSKLWGKVLGIRWDGFSDEQLASIKVPILLIVGDHDFVRLEHAVDAFRRIPSAELAVVPDASHFALFSEADRVIPLVQHFMEKPIQRLPVATAEAGYYPGKTR